MFVPRPPEYHGDSCAPLGALWKLPELEGKVSVQFVHADVHMQQAVISNGDGRCRAFHLVLVTVPIVGRDARTKGGIFFKGCLFDIEISTRLGGLQIPALAR